MLGCCEVVLIFLFFIAKCYSICIDDIAHTENVWKPMVGFHSREDEVFVFLSFFMVLLTTRCV